MIDFLEFEFGHTAFLHFTGLLQQAYEKARKERHWNEWLFLKEMVGTERFSLYPTLGNKSKFHSPRTNLRSKIK